MLWLNPQADTAEIIWIILWFIKYFYFVIMPSVVSRISSMREVSWNTGSGCSAGVFSLLKPHLMKHFLSCAWERNGYFNPFCRQTFPNGIKKLLQSAYAICQKSQPYLHIQSRSGGTKNVLFSWKGCQTFLAIC